MSVPDVSELAGTHDIDPTVAWLGFQAAFELSPNPMLLVAVDPPRFTMLAANRAHADAFFTTQEAIVGLGVFESLGESPDPQAPAIAQAIMLSFERMLATRAPDRMPVQTYVLTRRDGRTEEHHWSAVNTPVFDPDGAVRHILSTVRNVTAKVKEQQATEARALLMREVDHRARNALAVIQSVVRLSEGKTVDEFRRVVTGRVDALARAQGTLAQRKWEGAFLKDVVTAELAALGAPGAVRISGPAILLPPDKVQPMSMVLHELATNAAKYGALSAPKGMVSVTWDNDSPGRLRLSWREDGGPPIDPPRHHGFGSRLINRLAAQLDGEVRKDWNRDGLRVELTTRL